MLVAGCFGATDRTYNSVKNLECQRLSKLTGGRDGLTALARWRFLPDRHLCMVSQPINTTAPEVCPPATRKPDRSGDGIFMVASMRHCVEISVRAEKRNAVCRTLADVPASTGLWRIR